jgi:multidrug transporter EmrE-like cation transporter
LLQLFGAASLPATVLYPFVTGGSIVLSSLAGIIFFKDKLSKNVIASIILCFLGTILFL